MSATEARTALLTALEAMSPGFPTAQTNEKFTPTVGTPYQRADVLFAEPDNSEFGSNWQERGFMQVTLCYPVGTGSDAQMAKVEALRTAFRRGSSFSNGSTVVTVNRTPSVLPGQTEGAFFTVPVRVSFTAS